MHQRQLLHGWNFPHLVHGGVTLVAKGDAEKCLRTIIGQRCRLYGYEGFTLHDEGRIQPHMEWSASWAWDHLPPHTKKLDDGISPADLIVRSVVVSCRDPYAIVYRTQTQGMPPSFRSGFEGSDWMQTKVRQTTTMVLAIRARDRNEAKGNGKPAP